MIRILLGLAFLVPVQTLLPIRTFRPVEVLIIVMVGYAIWDRRESILPRPLLISFAFGLLSLVVSTAFSSNQLLSLDTGVLEFIVPFALLYLLVAYGDEALLQRAVVLFIAGVAVLSAAQIIAIAPGFPNGTPPFTGHDFLRMKMDIDLMRSALTIGNSDNYASLWVLALPLAVGLIGVVKPRWPMIIASVVIGYAGFLVYSRAALLLVPIALTALALVGTFRGHRREAITMLIAATLTLSTLGDPKSLGYFFSGVSGLTFTAVRTAASAPASVPAPAPAPKSAAVHAPPLASPDLSGTERADAMHKGTSIAMDRPLTGIGFGMYPFVEPIYTAPHSLAIQRFAEGGVLGLLSFLIIAIYPPIVWVKAVFSRKVSWFRITCLTALCAFMVKSVVFGATMAISSNIVWGFGVALLLAASIKGDGNDRAENSRLYVCSSDSPA